MRFSPYPNFQIQSPNFRQDFYLLLIFAASVFIIPSEAYVAKTANKSAAQRKNDGKLHIENG